MMGKLTLLLTGLALSCSIAFAQVSSTFMRTFSAPGMNGGLALEVTSDGGFIGTGQHEIDVNQSCDLYVYKVNSCGDPEWFKTYGGLLEDGGKSIKQTADGGFIVAGLTKMINGEYDMWLMKLDVSGNVTWNKIIGAGPADYGLHVTTTSDGGYILTGFLSGLGWGAADISLVKTDANGNIQWYKIYGGAGDDWGDYVTQTSDGGYLVTGYTSSYGAGGADVYMLKTDANGTLQWTKTFGTPGDDSQPWGNYAANTPDGGYVVCSHTNGSGTGSFDFWVFRTDALGNLMWSNSYGGAGEESARHIEPTLDGGFIVCGYSTGFGAGAQDAYVVKIDANGNHLWSKVYGGAGNEKGSCVRTTDDGGYAMSLFSTSFGADYYDPIFMKTDSAGNVGCNESSAPTIVTPFVPTISSGGNEGVPAVVISSPALTTGSFSPVDNFLCFQCNTDPQFVANDTLVCIGQPVDFFNTTTIGLRCHESWEVNGVTVSGIDTMTYSFPSPGIYTVSLLGHCGPQSDTMSASVFVIPDPVADFSFSNQCQDTVITFTNQSSPFVLTTLIQNTWDFGDGSAFSNDTNPVHQYAAPGNYNVSLTVEDNEHCTHTVTKQVTVFPLPVAAFNFSNVCDFNPVVFTDASTVLTGSISNWDWSFGDGNSSTAQSPSHLYTGANQYTVTLVVTTDSNCVASATQNATVHPVPVPDFSVLNSCLTITSQFNDLGSISSGSITSHNWDFGDGNTSSQVNPTNLYTTPGTYTVKLITTSNNSCVDSITHPVTIHPIPVPDFSFTDTCQGMTVAFNDLSSVSSGAISAWDWNFGDNTNSVAQSPAHAFAQPGTFNVQLKVTSDNNCSDSVTYPVTAYPVPVSDFTFTNVCFPNQNTYTNTSTVVSGSIVLSDWNFGDGTTSSLQNPSVTYAAPGIYNVVLISETNTGCRDTVAHSVELYDTPVADFSATTPCIGNATQFTDLSTPTGLATTFNWLFGDGNSATSQNPSQVYASAGNYNVQLIAISGNMCADTVTQPVTVLGKSTAQFTAPAVCLNDSTVFTNSTDTTVYPVNAYWWDLGDGNTGTQTNPVHLYASTGNFNVTLMADYTNGCSDTVTQPVTVYVLPTVSAVTTNVSCFGGSDGSVQLAPVAGQSPFTYLWSNASTGQTNSSLTSGTYDVTFTDANQCTASATYNVTEPTPLVVDTLVSAIVCYGYDNGSIELLVSGATPPYSMVWNSGSTSGIITNLSPGVYTVTVTDALGCVVSESITLLQPPPYQVVMDTVVTINLGESIELSPVAANGNAVSWEWSPATFLSCTGCQNPVAQPFITYTYNVQSISDEGCVADKSVVVTVIPKYIIYIPNAITPNGDGVNDYFEVFGNKESWKYFSLQVFDRIGEKVFETNDMHFKWDAVYQGKPLNPGVLVYTIRLVYIDNHTAELYKGSITLLR